MRTYRFYKEEGTWFIDLKWFPFNKAWLAMVAGADTLLDRLSSEGDEITLNIDTYPIPYSDGLLDRFHKSGIFNGALYEGLAGYNFSENSIIKSVWLCPATLWVFGYYPKTIYYKIVEK